MKKKSLWIEIYWEGKVEIKQREREEWKYQRIKLRKRENKNSDKEQSLKLNIKLKSEIIPNTKIFKNDNIVVRKPMKAYE